MTDKRMNTQENASQEVEGDKQSGQVKNETG